MQTRLRLVWLRDPITVLLTWKPHPHPGHLVLLMLLKQGKKRIALLIAGQNLTDRTSGWLKEDYVWKPGVSWGYIVLFHWPVALGGGKPQTLHRDKTIKHSLPLRMKLCVPRRLSRGGIGRW